MDDATSLTNTVESETLSAEVEKDVVCSAGTLTPTTPELHKHTVKSDSSSSGYSYHSASSGEQIDLLNFPMSTSSLVIAPKTSHVSAVPHSQTKQATILHSTGEREHEVSVCDSHMAVIMHRFHIHKPCIIQSMTLHSK